MNNEKTIELDITYNSTEEYNDLFALLCSALKNNLRVELIEAKGPGGWPIYRFSGEETNLRKFYRDDYCCGNDPESFDPFETYLV